MQVEQRLLGPVQILDEDDRRPVGDKLSEKLDPRLVQAVRAPRAGGERPPASSPSVSPRPSRAPSRRRTVSGGVVLLDAEVLLEDLARAAST